MPCFLTLPRDALFKPVSAKISQPSYFLVHPLLCFPKSQEWGGVLQFDFSSVLPLGMPRNPSVLHLSEFQRNKYKIPLGTIKTSGFNNAELVLLLNESLCAGIAPQSLSEVACLIFFSILLQKGRNKRMIVFVALLHPRK